MSDTAKMDRNLTLEGVKIGARNFSGKKARYNAEGDRNFLLLLPFDVAQQLEREGYWKVKWLKPRDEDDDPQGFIKVTVRYDNVPPRVVLVTSRGQNDLDEDTVGMLDWVRISNVDLIVSPYEWDVDGESGVKAYLKKAYITIEEDDLDRKYVGVPDAGKEE